MEGVEGVEGVGVWGRLVTSGPAGRRRAAPPPGRPVASPTAPPTPPPARPPPPPPALSANAGRGDAGRRLRAIRGEGVFSLDGAPFPRRNARALHRRARMRSLTRTPVRASVCDARTLAHRLPVAIQSARARGC